MMPTFRLRQEAADAMGTHRVTVEFEEGQSRWSAPSKVRLDLDQLELERLRWYLEDYLEYPIDPAPAIAAQVEQRLVELGRNLFDQVFQGREAIRLWDQAEPNLASTRVEVVTDVAGATAIPWELLRDPLTNTPLVLRADAFVRTHPQPARLLTPPDQAVERLRILLVICRPGGADDVPFRSVASHLVRASDDARQAFDLDVLRPPTFTRLGQVLRTARDRGRPYHIVHFDGHGIWADLGQAGRGAALGPLSRRRYGDSRSGAHGYLLFEDPDTAGNVRYVNGPQLGDLLAQTSVPVLVLNACRSAHAELAITPEEAAAQVQASPEDPHARVRAYGSLAQEVIDQGVAGVVAMRYTVYVVTAARFVGELYASLLAGQGLAEAVSRGRQHLADDPTREVALRPMALQDWMVPVVYETAPTPLVARPTTSQLSITVPLAATGERKPEAETTLPGPPAVGFFGRDETLLALDRAFDSQRIVLLYAFAGAGKTTTSAEFARWYERTGGLAHPDGGGPVLFTAFTRHRPLAQVLDQVGEAFSDVLQGAGVAWNTLDHIQRRDVAVQVLGQVPVLWIWDNVEPVAGFPAGTPSAWSAEEQQELRTLLEDLQQQTRAKVLLTSRRDERDWLGDLPARVKLPPMPMAERVQLARAIADKHGHGLTEVKDWRPLLAYTQGNPLTVTVLVGQALREGLRERRQVEAFVARLRAGEATLADDEREGRTRSLGASLGYGFTHAFSQVERAQLALLHLFQGFVNVNTLRLMGDPKIATNPVEAVRGLTYEQGIALLDRAAEVGLLNAYGWGYYDIHPALPWYFEDLFTKACGPTGSPAALQAARAYTTAIAGLGNYYLNEDREGRRHVIEFLKAEEANLLHARRLALARGWWDEVLGTMQGLRALYDRSGRRVEWARLVEELVPDLVDPATDGPLPGPPEELWAMITAYRVDLAQEQRDYTTAERMQRAVVAWHRQRAAEALATPAENLNPEQRHLIHDLSSTLHELGRLLLEQGDSSCADAFRESLELARRMGDRPGEAIAAYNLGRAYLGIPKLRTLSTAEDWLQRSLELHDEADHLGRARVISGFGYLHYERFEIAKGGWSAKSKAKALEHLNAAASAYHQALDLYPADAVVDRAVAHNELGVIYSDGDKLDKAVHHWQEAIRYDEASGERYGAAEGRFNIALALSRRGRFRDALPWAQAALRDYDSFGERASTGIVKANALLARIKQQLAGMKT